MANHHFLLPHGARRVACAVAAVLLAIATTGGALAGDAASPPLFFAQFDSSPAASPTSAGGFNWQMPAKIGAIAAISIVGGLVCFFVVYPAVLKRGHVWPVTLFGRVAAAAWLIACLTALAALWDDLVFPDELGGTNFWREHGGRMAVIAVGIGFAFVWLYLWRSDAPQKSTATQ
jgi:hypothetical protein